MIVNTRMRMSRGGYLLASVSVATCTIMPIDCIFLIEVDRLCEVSDSLVEFEESIPDETSSIIGRCVVLIH